MGLNFVSNSQKFLTRIHQIWSFIQVLWLFDFEKHKKLELRKEFSPLMQRIFFFSKSAGTKQRF